MGSPRRLVAFPGSPPRVRGIVCDKRPIAVKPGITPACAGNSEPIVIDDPEGEDHPRVCGE